MRDHPDRFEIRQAASVAERAGAYALRYEVFVAELGATGGEGVDHHARHETDAFDPHCDQLLLIDRAQGDRIAGTYRVMDGDQAVRAGGFYSEGEYDLRALRTTGRRMMEFGRSCLHPEYRGGLAMHAMWAHILRMVRARQVELLFGVGSFPGTDIGALAQPLAALHHGYLAPEELRPIARAPGATAMDHVAPDALDRKAAMRAMPALIKAYLRLGAVVGQGAYVDQIFNTTDVCLILDIAQLNPRQAALYERAG